MDIRWRPEAAPARRRVRHTAWGLADPAYVRPYAGGTLEVEIKEDGMVYMVGEVGYVGHIQLGNELSEQLRIK